MAQFGAMCDLCARERRIYGAPASARSLRGTAPSGTISPESGSKGIAASKSKVAPPESLPPAAPPLPPLATPAPPDPPEPPAFEPPLPGVKPPVGAPVTVEPPAPTVGLPRLVPPGISPLGSSTQAVRSRPRAAASASLLPLFASIRAPCVPYARIVEIQGAAASAAMPRAPSARGHAAPAHDAGNARLAERAAARRAGRSGSGLWR